MNTLQEWLTLLEADDEDPLLRAQFGDWLEEGGRNGCWAMRAGKRPIEYGHTGGALTGLWAFYPYTYNWGFARGLHPSASLNEVVFAALSGEVQGPRHGWRGKYYHSRADAYAALLAAWELGACNGQGALGRVGG